MPTRKKKIKISKSDFYAKKSIPAEVDHLNTCVDLTKTSLPKKIKSVTFSTPSNVEINKSGVIEINQTGLYDDNRLPVKGGVLDRRLGISDRNSKCQTCGEKLASCSGHFGYITLELPVFHVGFYKHLQKVLQSICFECSHILLESTAKAHFLKRIDLCNDSLERGKLQKRILEICRRAKNCFHCNASTGNVTKVAKSETLKLVHNFKQPVKGSYQYNELITSLEEKYLVAIENSPELKSHLTKISTPMDPVFIEKVLLKIPKSDVPLLWLHPVLSSPEQLLIKTLPVPPVALRPSIPLGSGFGSRSSKDKFATNEDDLTMKLSEIVFLNSALKKALQGEKSPIDIKEYWNALQNLVTFYINGHLPGMNDPSKTIRGLVQRLKGKRGRFRENLSGKRADFTARTVISPDPNLKITQVGIPRHIAKTLTIPERVTKINIEELRKLIINGPYKHPGASYIRQNHTNLLKALKYGDRLKAATEIKIGDIVERHLRDGDYVLFNRQPSLHKMSMMCHEAKVLRGKTLRFNECVCDPYNADFDGDEMNLHLPQTLDAKAEAIELMGVIQNLVTPRHGAPIIKPTQDFFTATFLLTQKNVFFTRQDFCQVVLFCANCEENIILPKPCILKPIELWSGKQVWKILFSEYQLYVNGRERNYSKFNSFESKDKIFCKEDGYVVIRGNELLLGNIGKGVLGSSKSGIMYKLIESKNGFEKAANFLNRLTKMTTRWLSNSGFTIGLDDVTPSAELLKAKKKVIQQGYSECERKLKQYREGTLKTLPGCNLEESLESEMSGILSRVRDESGAMCMKTLPRHNKPFVMATSGAKGSALNICQMVSCVGQQIVGGKRMPNGFLHRSLPHFKFRAKKPAAKGFVENSFFSGLTSPEFFFHTMGGREGLVDTAVKTAETGYLARRLMKALEDLYIAYDGTVRNSVGTVVQFKYGSDGLDPAKMATRTKPVDSFVLFQTLSYSMTSQNYQPLSMIGLNKFIEKDLSKLLTKSVSRYESKSSKHLYSVVWKELTEVLLKIKQLLQDKLDLLHIKDSDMNKLQPSRNPFYFPTLSEDELKLSTGGEENERVIAKLRALYSSIKVTKELLEKWVNEVVEKYMRAEIQPGEAVGALGGQSLGEPGTQMTLKTFHFAGVASMNVTLGVPRVKEIINATKSISTPIITVTVNNPNDERTARVVQGRIEPTFIGDICSYIDARISITEVHLVVKLDRKAINNLHLDISTYHVAKCILEDRKLKLKGDNIRIYESRDEIHVSLPPATKKTLNAVDLMLVSEKNKLSYHPSRIAATGTLYFECTSMKQALSRVQVSGIKTVQRAVINISEEKENNKKAFHLLVEGLGFLSVLGTPGVNPKTTLTNHVIEIEQVLGIEAARTSVMKEVAYIFSRYGLSIDERHLMLLADLMSYKGEILGITRHGLAKMKESVLMLASFETTAEHLFDASVHARKDEIKGVSECIILGSAIPLGTGLCRTITNCWNEDTYKPRERKIPIIQQVYGKA